MPTLSPSTSTKPTVPKHSTRRLVVLGTGGTIAGRARAAGDNVGYTAGEVGVADLLAGVSDMAGRLPALAGWALEAEQVAQIDSKDMGPVVWRALLERVAHHLARPEVAGVVVTHGTDTLEETAWLGCPGRGQVAVVPRPPYLLLSHLLWRGVADVGA